MFYWRHGSLLLYGDAVAHINIARRVFDSRTAGLLQLGTVWLPLPHLAMIPFLLSERMWQTGIGGSLPCLIAYVLGTVGIFRLVRGGLDFAFGPSPGGRVAAWLAAAVYGANPNLIYLQATAMTESIYLALFIWALVHFREFVELRPVPGGRPGRASAALRKSALCLAGACLTRYDGWFLVAIVSLAASFAVLRWGGEARSLLPGLRRFLLLATAAPLLWIAYNALVYRNPWEFANGPYSAQAIARKSTSGGESPHPGTRNLPVAFSFFLKSAELTMAQGISQKLWLLFLVLGAGISLTGARACWPFLLTLSPLPFYSLSVAYGGVPIFVPPWWPFAYYNLRYGVELLPAFAVFTALAAYWLMRAAKGRTAKIVIASSAAIFVGLSYGVLWHGKPVCFEEALVNSRSRVAVETELGANLRKLPHRSTILMFLGDHAGALERAGIPLRRTINEGDHRGWIQPEDPKGLWERALASPAQYADYVVASSGDPVATAIDPRQLTPLVLIRVSGQPQVTLYWAHPQPEDRGGGNR
jgi:hypothetical protein